MTAKMAIAELAKFTNFPSEFMEGVKNTAASDELMTRADIFNSLVDALLVRRSEPGVFASVIEVGVLFWPVVNVGQFSLRQIVRIMRNKPISWQQWLDETKSQWEQYHAAYMAAERAASDNNHKATIAPQKIADDMHQLTCQRDCNCCNICGQCGYCNDCVKGAELIEEYAAEELYNQICELSASGAGESCPQTTECIKEMTTR